MANTPGSFHDQDTVPPREPARVSVTCPACGKGMKVKRELVGKKVKCPHCKQGVQAADATLCGNRLEARTLAPGKLGADTCAYPPPQKETFAFLAPPQAADELGRLGPYRVLRVLGAGGMGVVFRAEDPHLARPVALKAMLPALAASDSARQRFLREARAAAAIKHDHIVTIHQVGEDRGVPFLAMEFLEGQPLDVRLERERKLPLGEVLRISTEIALALAAAHQRDLIHRDIKPANIWLETQAGTPAGAATAGRVKILDFGLARAVSEEGQLTQQGAIVGTPAYMAPEQGQGKKLDARCDLFSLGCVLYRMATGEPAFRGTDIVSTLMAVATTNPPPPVALEPTLPPALSDLIMALLAKLPQDRPPSALAVVEALQKIAQDTTQKMSALSGQARRKRVQRLAASFKKWRTAGGVAVCLLMLVLIGAWALRAPTKRGTNVGETVPPASETIAQGKQDKGFVPLFNGKDLTGWFVEGGDAKAWTVADGEIIAWGKDWRTRNYLLSERAYADFALRLEYNLAKGANSGIVLRAFRGEKVPYQGQGHDMHPLVSLYETRGTEETGTTHWILNTHNLAPSRSAEQKPAGEWNRLQLEMKGHALRAWVNDNEIAQLTLAANSLLEDGSLPALNRSRGRIGLFKHHGTVRFRNIDIKELPEPTPSAMQGNPMQDKAGKRFPVRIAEHERSKWRVMNGYLEQTTQRDFAQIRFGDRNWSDYDFSIDFLRLKGDNQCGLLFLDDDEKRQGSIFGLGTHQNRFYSVEWRGKARPDAGWVQKPGGIPNGVWHQARVSMRAGHARCFLNGKLILECTIDSHKTGAVGLRTYWSYYQFRNIKVTDPSGKVLLEGLPDLDSAWPAP